MADEIFLQMAEMRKEIKQQQDKVSALELQAAVRRLRLSVRGVRAWRLFLIVYDGKV